MDSSEMVAKQVDEPCVDVDEFPNSSTNCVPYLVTLP